MVVHFLRDTHKFFQCILLFFSALAFALLMVSGLYPPELRSVNLDIDWLYRKVGFDLTRFVRHIISTCWKAFASLLHTLLDECIKQTKVLASPSGVLAKTWSTSTGTSWMLIILAISLAILFFA